MKTENKNESYGQTQQRKSKIVKTEDAEIASSWDSVENRCYRKSVDDSLLAWLLSVK